VTFVSASVAAAALCGDEVDGQRVACSCGDVLVSSTTLRSEDPVIQERCPSDGLILRAGPGGARIVLDVAGLSLIGLGGGTGIRVLDGGEGGAIIIGGSAEHPGHVAGFGTGLRASGRDNLAEVHNLVLEGNVRDGLALRSSDTLLVNVDADKNGRDGLRVGGRNPELSGVDATGNHRYGLRVTARGGSVDANAAENGRAAARVSPRRDGEQSVEVRE